MRVEDLPGHHRADQEQSQTGVPETDVNLLLLRGSNLAFMQAPLIFGLRWHGLKINQAGDRANPGPPLTGSSVRNRNAARFRYLKANIVITAMTSYR